MNEIVLIKLGGSLVTDKLRPGVARLPVIDRLGVEVSALAKGLPCGVVLGHGSGSFGHVAARRHNVKGELTEAGQIDGVALTRSRAAQLNQMLVQALIAGGSRPFAYPPSSWMMAAKGEPSRLNPEPLLHGLRLGLLPVVYGDVVMDADWGASICSTETVFLALAKAMKRRGLVVRRSFWLGETEGIYGDDGATMSELTPSCAASVLQQVSGAAGEDVTGGMRHRLESALELARLGISSWIGDGTTAGILQRVIDGESVPGTWVRPDVDGPPTEAEVGERDGIGRTSDRDSMG